MPKEMRKAHREEKYVQRSGIRPNIYSKISTENTKPTENTTTVINMPVAICLTKQVEEKKKPNVIRRAFYTNFFSTHCKRE